MANEDDDFIIRQIRLLAIGIATLLKHDGVAGDVQVVFPQTNTEMTKYRDSIAATVKEESLAAAMQKLLELKSTLTGVDFKKLVSWFVNTYGGTNQLDAESTQVLMDALM